MAFRKVWALGKRGGRECRRSVMVSSSQHKLLIGSLLQSPRRRFHDGLFCGRSAEAGSRTQTAPSESKVCEQAIMGFLCSIPLFLVLASREISCTSVSTMSSTRQRHFFVLVFWILEKTVPVWDPIPETCSTCFSSFPLPVNLVAPLTVGSPHCMRGISFASAHRWSCSLLSNACRCRFTIGACDDWDH